MRVTRTHTVYWDEGSVAPLNEAIAELRKDLDHRRPYIDSDAAAAMDTRLVLLESAAKLLTDWAD